jgi:ATP-binding cassette subfamily B (MDR/TAP) protein 1
LILIIGCRPPPRLFIPPLPQDCISPNYSKPPSPRMVRSPSLKRQNCVRDRPDFLATADSQTSNLTLPPIQSSRENENGNVEMQTVKSEQSVKRQDSFENAYSETLSQINLQRQTSNSFRPESPISPLLTDPEDERSHSKTFSRSPSQCKDFEIYQDEPASASIPSLWKLAKLSSPEWFCAFLGSLGAILFGSLNPLFAFLLVQIAEVYYYSSQSQLSHELSKWCSILVGLALATILANFLQHFYFGIMGEKMTERVRRLMFSGIQ